MKIVSQLDAKGYLIGAAIADESPMEPDVYLIPGGCVDAAPIEVPAGKRAKWTSEGFSLEDLPEPPKPEEPMLPTAAEIIEAQRQAVRAVREQVLDRLTGIAGRASRKGDTVLAEACDTASEALLDITKDLPTEPDAVKLTLLNRYLLIREAAIQAAPSLKNAFAQVDA